MKYEVICGIIGLSLFTLILKLWVLVTGEFKIDGWCLLLMIVVLGLKYIGYSMDREEARRKARISKSRRLRDERLMHEFEKMFGVGK